MPDLHTRIREFFKNYEEVNREFDVRKIAACYADVFMFAGPMGVQSVKKDDFVKALPRRKEFFKSVGLVSSKVESVEASNLDPKYFLAKVVWRMQFECDGASVDSENSATYIITAMEDRLEIVFQIDHQDLAKRALERAEGASTLNRR